MVAWVLCVCLEVAVLGSQPSGGLGTVCLPGGGSVGVPAQWWPGFCVSARRWKCCGASPVGPGQWLSEGRYIAVFVQR